MQTAQRKGYQVFWLALLVVFAEARGASSQDQHTDHPPSSQHFPYPAALRPQVEFWKQIFATYSRYQVVIHDAVYMDKVYTVLDFRPLLTEHGLDEAQVGRLKNKETQQAIRKIRATLYKLDTLNRRGVNPSDLTPQERRVWNLYRDINDRHKFGKAADEKRLRSQSGLRERFGEGIRVSRRYLLEMQHIFQQEGVPIELIHLPLIESCFDLRAYSKAGAAGIWQFIPSTGRLYMRIDNALDERRDPLISTRAAARLLKANYQKLGTWPLAITAYNHGPAGMQKAVKTVGTRDIAKIIRSYRGKYFGFASRNFYPEFLAALEIEKEHQKHFGSLQMELPFRYEEVQLASFLPLKTAAHCARLTEAQLITLNPAFNDPIRSGRLYIPQGYRLRVPPGTSQQFQVRYAALSSHERPQSQPPLFALHKVQRGQTLGGIARRYGTSITILKQLNGIRNVHLVQAGRTLRVPVNSTARSGIRKRSGGQPSAFITHIVQRGQTLGGIARRYGTTVASLKQLNGVKDARRLRAGQKLLVPVS